MARDLGELVPGGSRSTKFICWRRPGRAAGASGSSRFGGGAHITARVRHESAGGQYSTLALAVPGPLERLAEACRAHPTATVESLPEATVLRFNHSQRAAYAAVVAAELDILERPPGEVPASGHCPRVMVPLYCRCCRRSRWRLVADADLVHLDEGARSCVLVAQRHVVDDGSEAQAQGEVFCLRWEFRITTPRGSALCARFLPTGHGPTATLSCYRRRRLTLSTRGAKAY